jgi:ribosomal-protein-alanine N-acetyltransferase
MVRNFMENAIETKAGPIVIRYGQREDLRRVASIESQSFEFPWEEKDFLGAMVQKNSTLKVAVLDGQIVGFIMYDLHRPRISLLNMAVSPAYRRKGIGRSLVEFVIGKLKEGYESIGLGVRETNLDAQLFFRDGVGFEYAATAKDTYEESQEDAYIFEYFREDIPEWRKMGRAEIAVVD